MFYSFGGCYTGSVEGNQFHFLHRWNFGDCEGSWCWGKFNFAKYFQEKNPEPLVFAPFSKGIQEMDGGGRRAAGLGLFFAHWDGVHWDGQIPRETVSWGIPIKIGQVEFLAKLDPHGWWKHVKTLEVWCLNSFFDSKLPFVRSPPIHKPTWQSNIPPCYPKKTDYLPAQDVFSTAILPRVVSNWLGNPSRLP